MTRQMIVRSVFLLLCLVSLSKGVTAPDETPAAQTKNNVTEAKAPAKEAEAPAKEAEAPAKEAEAPAKEAEAPAKEAEAPAKKAEAPAKDPKTPANETTVPEKEAKGEIKTESIEDDVVTLPLRMPNVLTSVHDTYLVTPVKVDYDDAYIVGYVPQVGSLTIPA